MNLENNKTAFLFPGQGSQKVGMGKELGAQNPIAMTIFDEADDILGFKLSELSWLGPEEALNDTVNTQPALLVHSVASLRVLQEQHPTLKPAFVAGHSMGELTALVAAEALSFSEALKLVRRRGELMKQAGEISPGGMGAILNLDLQQVVHICLQASDNNEIVQVANDNCPGQVVISGHKAALERAMVLAKKAGARKAVTLAVSIAAHSPLMAHAQNEFNLAVKNAPISDPKITIVGNVSAIPLSTAQEIRDDLQAQLSSRVRWTESVQYMLDNGVTNFIEIGTGQVLISLVKRIERKSIRIKLGSPQDFEKLNSTES